MVWIGDRTRQLDGAHVELLSGIANPIGPQSRPKHHPDGRRALCDRLDPGHIPGRLVLIARLGANKVADMLPPLLQAVADRPLVWTCDPMHGNTFVSESGYKTRRLTDILTKISGFFAACKAEGTHPSGVHLELAGEDVTECVGGVEEVLDMHLGTRVRS
jgi:3-deoxy-7-phosphoheptulonate synthase